MLVRHQFYLYSFVVCFILFFVGEFYEPVMHLLWIAFPLFLVGLYDCTSRHNLCRNYPIIVHIRYFLESIRPEIQQYFIKGDLDGRPFNRQQRSVIYQRAKGESDVEPFGTKHDVTKEGYVYAYHAHTPKHIDKGDRRFVIGKGRCEKAYSASRLNISAMSYGALSGRAIHALNAGAKIGGMFHNTGEGGISPYHLKGGDLVWQLGTGYFGCRDAKGRFSAKAFKKNAGAAAVKMIEVKLSQGAKPAHGGLLPKEKITEEIAAIRGIPMGQDCNSPAAHSAFSTPEECLAFLTDLRKLSGGKPVGIKLCVGNPVEIMALCAAMLKLKQYPDFITIDGSEGGTGAAPLEFTNRFGMPGDEGLAFVHNCLVGTGLRDKVCLLSSAKVITAFDIVRKLAMGADGCNVARPMMFALGCIQSLSCHNNLCPTGIATQDVARSKAIVVSDKSERVARFHRTTLANVFEMVGAMGLDHPDQLHADMIRYRTNDGTSIGFAELYDYLETGALLKAKKATDLPARYRQAWQAVFGKKSRRKAA